MLVINGLAPRYIWNIFTYTSNLETTHFTYRVTFYTQFLPIRFLKESILRAPTLSEVIECGLMMYLFHSGRGRESGSTRVEAGMNRIKQHL